MVVKSQIKFIKSLQQKKHRLATGLFVAEGMKMVSELLQTSIPAQEIYTTNPEFLQNHSVKSELVSEAELKRMSGLKSPNKVLAVFRIPEAAPPAFRDWTLLLDGVKDPGNMGTIIRLCDWFGISELLCSEDTVDCYNPKVLQATMGSIARVNIVYTDLEKAIIEAKLPVYGAFMEGENVYSTAWPEKGLLVMGNESHGISEKIKMVLNGKVSIPQFGRKSAESLNVATATAILLNEIRRPGA
jgi:TrmH family RNA methyltransferase